MAKNQVEFAFRGFVVGVFTPFNADLTLNTKLIPTYAKFLADSGVTGVLVNGSTSEGPSMTVKERKTVAEAWLPVVKQTKQHFMVQVGGCPLPDVLELARHAEKIKVDSLLCLPELYFKPKTPQDLIDYLKLISEAAPNTPLLYYNNTVRSGTDINMEQFLNLAVDQIPTLRGIKFVKKDLSEAYDAKKSANGRYTVIATAESLVQPSLAHGFDSFSTSSLNIFPRHYVKIVEAMKENRIEDARALQEDLTAACKSCIKHGDGVPTMKAAMNLITPIKVGPVRPPLKNPTEEQQKQMAADLKKYKLSCKI